MAIASRMRKLALTAHVTTSVGWFGDRLCGLELAKPVTERASGRKFPRCTRTTHVAD
jgi:hypothetical protein